MIKKSDTSAAISKISMQFRPEPYHRLMCAIVCTAIHDLSRKDARILAIDYIENDLIHAELCGVNSDWVRRVLREMRLID